MLKLVFHLVGVLEAHRVSESSTQGRRPFLVPHENHTAIERLRCDCDDEDYKRVSRFKWCSHRCCNMIYASRNVLVGHRRKTLRMHQFIMGWHYGEVVDHINGNGLDNRRANLRMCSDSQNQWNRRLNRNNKSGFKGVCLHRNKWIAQIACAGRNYFLGYFKTQIEAAHCYDEAAIVFFGQFAVTNTSLGLIPV